MSDGTVHGDALSPADRRLLRDPPPARARHWVEAAVGAGARVVRCAPLKGGTSSAVHAVDVRAGTTELALVLRRFVRRDWLAEEPDVAWLEAATLELLAGSGVPAPELLAVDPDGAATGAPAVLMTRLAGAVVWRPDVLEPFLDGLAAALPPIHAVVLGDVPLAPYDPFELTSRRPPAWSRRPGVWERAFAIFDGPAPETPGAACLIHRDFHPGNVLWSGGAVTGVVDWASARIGRPEADVGHCRWNLARALGQAAADAFLARTGAEPYHPYWDIVAALGRVRRDRAGGEGARRGGFPRARARPAMSASGRSRRGGRRRRRARRAAPPAPGARRAPARGRA